MQNNIPITTLKNGIRVIHQEVQSPISHFGVLINAGTRDEADDKGGLAHFVEHTIFKGTVKRNSYQVTKRVENAGGDLNACTSKEETDFHVSFLSPDYERSIELMSDIFFNATFPEKELTKEKDVVLEEINYYKDSPAELIFDDIEDIVFAGHPLGRNILGTKKSVKLLQRNNILDFIRQNYTSDHVVLSSVGNISTDQFLKYCNKYFGEHPLPTSPSHRTPFTDYRPTFTKKHKNTSQSHIIMGTTAYTLHDPQRVPFTLLTNLLGGQAMSAKLNVAIREKKGLAYSVEANYSPFSDAGLFTVYIGCDNHTTDKCIELTFKELKKISEQKLGTLQLHYAKKQFLGQWAITNETKLNEMLSMGRSALSFNEVETSSSAIQKIESITTDQILHTANEIFNPDNFTTLLYSKI
ncbi:MAG TPA: pitrilysin family protein [Bacteroidales bacterium]|nr:pitrilysin family protein [Bacteroidales bacterium]